MSRSITLAYGMFCYAIGMGSLVYMMGWLINVIVPHSIDSSGNGSMTKALLINAGLFLCYGLHHSVMARPAFKAKWTKFVPEAIERSTYILLSGAGLLAVMLLWQPMGVEIWNVESVMGRTALFALYGVGWAILVGSTFALNHFDLFGLRQVWSRFRNQPCHHLEFATPGPYRMVRHPLYVGWITLVWATPTMTVAHLVFAVATTGYILVAIQFEERDLVEFHGEHYVNYRKRTPMLIPSVKSRLPDVEPSISSEETPANSQSSPA